MLKLGMQTLRGNTSQFAMVLKSSPHIYRWVQLKLYSSQAGFLLSPDFCCQVSLYNLTYYNNWISWIMLKPDWFSCSQKLRLKWDPPVYGKHITVQNDHKPLEIIQRKSIHTAWPRLQHMLLCLQKYDYTIQYIPGQNMVLPDRLSRFPSPCNNLPTELHQNIHALNFHPDRLLIIQGAIEHDPIHLAVYRMTFNGWPNRVHDVPHLAHQLWSLRDELTIDDGVLLKGNHVCIPPELHDRTLLWLTWQLPRHWKNDPHCKSKCELARHRCRYSRLCEKMYNLYQT